MFREILCVLKEILCVLREILGLVMTPRGQISRKFNLLAAKVVLTVNTTLDSVGT